jgi:hypothetical protein
MLNFVGLMLTGEFTSLDDQPMFLKLPRLRFFLPTDPNLSNLKGA